MTQKRQRHPNYNRGLWQRTSAGHPTPTPQKFCAVYQIINTKTGGVYIGSTVNLHRRWAQHQRHLMEGTHHVAELQADINAHGHGYLRYEVLEVSTPEAVRAAEAWWIWSALYKGVRLYNAEAKRRLNRRQLWEIIERLPDPRYKDE